MEEALWGRFYWGFNKVRGKVAFERSKNKFIWNLLLGKCPKAIKSGMLQYFSNLIITF
jgi:hypothetical protein